MGVEKIQTNPIILLEENLEGGQIVLNIAAEKGIRTLLALCPKIYEQNLDVSLTEDLDRALGSQKIVRRSYSEVEVTSKLRAFELYKQKSCPLTFARFINTVGTRQSGSYWMVLPIFVKAAISNQPLIVYGDGTQSRTFCSVTDVVDTLMLLMVSKEIIGKAFDIVAINGIKITEITQKVFMLTNSTSEIIHKKHYGVFGDNSEESQRKVPDISKINKLIDWQPKQSFDEGIVEITKYLKANDA